MKKIIFISAVLSSTFAFGQNHDSVMIKKIFDEILTRSTCYSNLDYLSNKIGGRLSGSPEAAKAVEWAFKAMKEAGADTVFLQECMVPHWVRGEKEVVKTSGLKNNTEFSVCALGGSVGTGAAGITANVIEVKNMDELAKLGKNKVEGKIVFFNHPMDPKFISTYHAYGKAVGHRWSGPSEAAKYGAVGSIVRSMTLANDDNPHTGTLGYKDSIKKIPALAISTKGADQLSNMLKKDNSLQLFIRTTCETLPDEKSYNVVGEIRGSDKKDEIILAGGHLDSWDNGDGAHDDGTGVVQAIEVLRTFKAMGIKPRRTIRAVAFMNEENGGRGGAKYAELAKKNNEKNIAAIESDGGGFTPRGFGIEASPEKINSIARWKPLLAPYGLHEIGAGHGGADISHLEDQGTVLIGFMADSQRYFDYHHTAIDTFDKVNKRELELGAASIAALVWLISERGF